MTRILIVDDDELVRSTLSRILVASNYDVLEAANGVQALKLFKGADIDIVVTDILMPEKEGIETIRELRQADKDVKIMAISGGDRAGRISYLELAQKLGADGVLAKPIRRGDFLAMIKSLLEA